MINQDSGITIFNEDLGKLYNALQEIEVLELIILKGQLVTQQLLIKQISAVQKDPKAINMERLSFATIIKLHKSLYHGQHDKASWIWKGLDQLRLMRNKIAHELELDKGLHEIISKFINEFDAELNKGALGAYERTKIKETTKALKMCIKDLYSQLSYNFNFRTDKLATKSQKP